MRSGDLVRNNPAKYLFGSEQQVEPLKLTEHPHCLQGGKRTVLVTEYMEKGDLCSALGRSPGKFAWKRLGRGVALDVARGLAFLHSRNVVVRLAC